MATSSGLLKDELALLYYGGTVTYAIVGYVLGVAGLTHASGLVNAVSIVLLAHAMTIAAYLIHECVTISYSAVAATTRCWGAS